MNAIIGFVGRSGSGKTTLIEKLIPVLGDSGLTVAVIKHTRHEFYFDSEGTDSFRFARSGAAYVALSNDQRSVVMSNIGRGTSPIHIAKDLLVRGASLAIIEGYKEGAHAKIEVVGDSSEPTLVSSGISGIIAVIADKRVDAGVPVFKRDDIESISKFIIERLEIF